MFRAMHSSLPRSIQLAVQDYEKRLTDLFGARLRVVRVFGSWIRGEANEHSDIDVAVIIEGLERAEWREALALSVETELQSGITLTPLVLAADRFAELLARERHIAQAILHAGGRVTDENRRRNALDELGLADSALTAAAALLDLGLAPDAASRMYYAAFHAVRALLLSIGLEPRSHRGVRSLFTQHFIRTGLFSSEHAKHLAQLEGLRSAGDYDSSFSISTDDLAPELEKARALVETTRQYLR